MRTHFVYFMIDVCMRVG